MKIITLKTFFKRCIYNSQSGVKVYQNIFYRWLTFNSKPIQTLLNRRHPEKPLLHYLIPLTIAVRAAPGNTCLLGLGGGAAAHYLMPFLEGMKLDIVENNLEIIDIAKTYFKTDALINTSIIHQDAAQFVLQHKSKYKHLIVDLSNADAFPTDCNTDLFFQHCFDCLDTDGIFAINLANTGQHWPILNRIQKICHQSTLLFPIKNSANIVILAGRGITAKELLNKFETHYKIKTLTWDYKWGHTISIDDKK